jgi:arachidonate 5-lipoxygenase
MLGWWEILSNDNKQCNDLILECSRSIGEVQVVLLENKAGGKHSWYVDFLEVHDFTSAEKRVFPCYHWIGAEDSISCSSSTKLLQDIGSNTILEKHRDFQIKRRREIYPWMRNEDLCLPSSIDSSVDLPLDEGFEKLKNFHFFSNALIGGLKSKVAGLSLDVDSLHGYEQYASLLGEPDFRVYELGRWMSDVEFGRQILNGVNPVIIRRCESLPAKFPVTNEMVQSSLHRGLTLDQEMEDGHVYICDLEIMDGVSCKDGTYCAAPLCLLYVNAVGQLKPIAIQLGQKPGNDNPKFLPTDHSDWIAAKMFYMSSHSQVISKGAEQQHQ